MKKVMLMQAFFIFWAYLFATKTLLAVTYELQASPRKFYLVSSWYISIKVPLSGICSEIQTLSKPLQH